MAFFAYVIISKNHLLMVAYKANTNMVSKPALMICINEKVHICYLQSPVIASEIEDC